VSAQQPKYDGPMTKRPVKPKSSAEEAEAVRVQRLREDAKRPMSVNLAEGIQLSRMLSRFAGAARKV